MLARFVADANLGKLAKWLRIAGYDVLYSRNIDDDSLIRIGLQDGRVVLTKDTHIPQRRAAVSGELKIILIKSDSVRDQLQQTAQTLDLDLKAHPLSLCIRCNQPLVVLAKEDIRDLVPPYVFKTHSLFSRCSVCGRIYWQGTHWDNMERELEELTSSHTS